MFSKIYQFISKLPVLIIVALFPLAIAAFIGGIIGLFYLLANVEGVGTAIVLLGGWFGIKLLAQPEYNNNQTAKQHSPQTQGVDKIVLAMGIAFFALMGAAIDQPGNFILNQPVQWIFCPSQSKLARYADYTNPLPGRTDITQDFQCLNPVNKQTTHISPLYVFVLRFFEYAVICYVLILGNTWWSNRKSGQSVKSDKLIST